MSTLPSSWTTGPLGDVAHVEMGQSPDSRFYNGQGEGLPFFQGKAEFGALYPTVRKWCSQPTKVAETGDILLSVRAPVGPTNLANEQCCIGRGLSAIRATAPISQKYLLNFFRHIEPWLAEQGTGSTFTAVSGGFLRKLEVPLAPLNEQKRIADKLDAVLARVDACRDCLDRVPVILKRFRQSVLAAAYTGQLTAGFRATATLTPVEESIMAVDTPPRPNRFSSRTDRMIDGDYALAVGKPDRSIPSGWRWTSLVDIARMESGHTPSRAHPEYWDGGDIPWIGIADARDGHGKTIYDTYQHTNSLGIANSAARLLPAGTVCLSRTASVGYVVRMGVDMATSQDFANWTCTEAINPDWLKFLLVAEKEAIYRFGKGSTHTTVYYPELMAFHVALPCIEEQAEIVRRIEALFDYADRLEARYAAALSHVERLTPALLTKAFCGELVPQDPNDEPASSLLARLAKSRQQKPGKKYVVKGKG